MIKGKKALTANMIIIIILAVVGANLLIWYLTSFPFSSMLDKEACHQSVLQRSMPLIEEAVKRTISLRCKTEDIVIDYGNEEQIQERIANAMYDCWWMLGEGRLNPFLDSTWKKLHIAPVGSVCVICSTIRFSDNVKKEFKEIDLTEYLKKEIPGKDMTYLEYFSGQEGAKLGTGARIEKIDTSKQYMVNYMGIEGDALWEPLAKDIGLGAGGAFLLGGAGGLKAFSGLLTKITNPIILAAILSTVLTQTGFAVQSQIASAVRCDGNTKGCRLVILSEYEPRTIEEICGSIESNP